ncbi:hypothetical protein J1902_00355 [Arthrobacter sp. PO-11]|uniref:Uncharacterized protein n=1 Tax=Arthrobacter cavernae TaxID=2817681 RepID=A0A939KM97_9MICC|nr:DUF6228 family protein [Arthrobacter cavernae]MBO1266445.1 hypothetical protein [Arthrobacter cavernae]
MRKVVIGRSQQLTFEVVQRGSDGEATSLLVSVTLKDLSGHRKVAAHYGKGFDDLSEFFEDLAGHWKGWPGTKSYESLEGDLLLSATTRAMLG